MQSKFLLNKKVSVSLGLLTHRGRYSRDLEMELTSNYQEISLMAMLASFWTWNLNCHKVARLTYPVRGSAPRS